MQPPPPPVIRKPRRTLGGPVVVAGILAAGFATMMVFYVLRTMFGLGVRPTIEDYAHGAAEKEVDTDDLRLGGTIAMADNRGLHLLDIASKAQRTVFQTRGDWRLWGVAGPNENGLVVFTDNDMMAKKHRLHVLDTRTGADRIILDRPGDALWDDAISENMAVAGTADVLVLQNGVDKIQLDNPQAYMSVCDLEIFNLKTGASRRFQVQALESRLAISNDGQSVYYVACCGRRLADWLRSPKGPMPTDDKTDLTPVVHRLNVATGTSEPIYPGWDVVGTPSDSLISISGHDGSTTLYDLSRKEGKPFEVPNYIGAAIGFASPGIVIASAKQARLEDVQMTRSNGLPGPRPMPRLVAYDPNSGRISTLVKAYDFRHHVSYSLWPKHPSTSRR